MNLFTSNLFQLQTEELLKNAQLPTAELEQALFKLKKTLDELPDQALENLSIPTPHVPLTQCSLSFKKPEKVHVVGSYLLQSFTRAPGKTFLDLAVQMPTVFLPLDSFAL